MKRVLPLHTLALLAALLCTFTATAYDFKVDSIAYNIISPSTVEVAHKGRGYSETEGKTCSEESYYSGWVSIPSSVNYNSVTYTVTSIGDSAFYNSAVTSVDIPATVTSIGKAAFYYCPELNEINCFAMNPPSINNSFEGVFLLLVHEAAYFRYKAEYEHYGYFEHILCFDGFTSNSPTISKYHYGGTRGCLFVIDNYGDNTEIYMQSRFQYSSSSVWYGSTEWFRIQGNSFFINCEDNYRPVYYDIDLFAIVDDMYYLPLYCGYPEELCFWNRGEVYDFSDDNGIAYGFVDSNPLALKACVTYWGNSFEEEGKDSYYSGNIVIPRTVHFAIWDYEVVAIVSDAFSGCKDLNSVTLPNTITLIDYLAFAGCSNLKRLTLPVSITEIRDGAFEKCSVDTVYLTGEGDWQGGALPGGVKTLFIGSGVTGVKGMQVNPETIYSYATTPPACDENSFTGYEAELHVPAASLAAYFTAPYWCNFTNIVGDAVPLTELTLNHDSIEVLVGNQANLTATLNPTNAMPSSVIWQSSDTTVATVNNGVVTALKAGSCDIFATCQDKYAVCHVTVTEIVPTAVTVTPESAKIEVGTQLTLTATVLPEDATDKNISWSSSKSSVATVDANGVVTAVGPGECDITAWCRGKSAKCHLIVVEHLIYITLDQHEASLLPNHMITLTPSVAPVSTDLVVTSSNPEVAAARLAGNKIQVVGVSEGEATIVIGSADGYAEPDSCLVTVYTERGDANNDGFVNISDVTSMITYLMTGNASDFRTVNADCNGDGKVTISDVTLLISHLMDGTELKPKDQDNEEITVNGVTFKMMRVKGGTFQMGSTTDQDPDAEAIESPVHAVTLSTYYIGMTEVTQELWQAVMGENPSEFTGDDQRPVERVTWDMCQEFITTLNALTGKTFRLPTEAEWEFAALGGNKSAGYRYAGSNDIDEVAWYSLNSNSAPHPVGLKSPNELGLFDMTGNVGEWCADRYGYYTEDAQTDPQGPETGKSRIYRGGSWSNNAKSCRLTRRAYFSPATIRNNMGLRLAL